MNRNDMRSVVYLIIALIAFYFLLDDFMGKNKITNWVNSFVGGFGGDLVPPAKTDPKTDPASTGAKQPSTQPATDTGKIPIPAPELDTGKIKIPQPQGAPKPKSGSTGWSLNDLIPHWSLPSLPIGFPAIVAGETVALPYLLQRAFGG